MALDQMCIAVMLLQAEPLTYTSVDLLLTFDIYSRSMCFISKVSFLISNTRARFDAIWNVPTLSCLERNAPLFLCCFCFFREWLHRAFSFDEHGFGLSWDFCHFMKETICAIEQRVAHCFASTIWFTWNRKVVHIFRLTFSLELHFFQFILLWKCEAINSYFLIDRFGNRLYSS